MDSVLYLRVSQNCTYGPTPKVYTRPSIAVVTTHGVVTSHAVDFIQRSFGILMFICIVRNIIIVYFCIYKSNQKLDRQIHCWKRDTNTRTYIESCWDHNKLSIQNSRNRHHQKEVNKNSPKDRNGVYTCLPGKYFSSPESMRFPKNFHPVGVSKQGIPTQKTLYSQVSPVSIEHTNILFLLSDCPPLQNICFRDGIALAKD